MRVYLRLQRFKLDFLIQQLFVVNIMQKGFPLDQHMGNQIG
ncbi:hypothetical protein SDC9_209724 [bioreactor metagenome]|uniref:Uncharacterized protein n=1 Tax=bioreactor metagenome TaxID=1076179 RepID=A0A645JE27_9ZZZZ